MKPLPTLAASLAMAFLVTPALAQEEPQEVRQDLMEEVGDAAGVMGDMLRGRRDYNPDEVIAALQTISENAAVFPDYFPEGSETGHKTEALPAIWENKDDFNANAEELSQAAAELAEAVPADMESFQPMFREFSSNCKGCHDDYRRDDG